MPQRPTQLLTRRELEVLQHLIVGHSYADTASSLEIGLGTVQTHVKSVYRKLGVASKAEATAMALLSNIIPHPRGRFLVHPHQPLRRSR